MVVFSASVASLAFYMEFEFLFFTVDGLHESGAGDVHGTWAVMKGVHGSSTIYHVPR